MPDIPAALRAALRDRYELEEMIGRGGMAAVYRARDLKHNRRVAVKVLRTDLSELIGPERFLREIEIAAGLTHPNILPLHDSGEADGTLYYVMPFVEGESLRALLSRVRLMDTDGALEIVRRVADALDYAHRRGILHRDIKPENILLPGGQAVLADFGIAKAVSSATSDAGLTRTGIALGTPGYMSPEQATGLLELAPTTDVYSLGVVTYEMLVGGLPRTWVMPDALRVGRFADAPPEHRAQLDRLPAGMERALVAALALRPEERLPSPGEFASALARPETLALPVRAPAPRPDLPVPANPSRLAAGRAPVATAALVLSLNPSGGLVGAPTTLMAERVIEGEVPPDQFDGLVEEARAAFHAVGHTSRTDRMLIWTARRPKKPFNLLDVKDMLESGVGGDAPDALVRVSVRGGETRIRVEQRLGEMAGGVFGGIMGGVGGGGMLTSLIVGFGAFNLPIALAAVAAAGFVGGSWALSRAIFRAVVASKQTTLDRLADQLAEDCEEAAD
jgi:tRNA A-37 threonylcarbamoyl transferase component Bud32